MVNTTPQGSRLNKPREAFLGGGNMVGQCVARNGDHVPRPLFKAAQFTCSISNGTAHLPGKLRNNFILHRQHGINCRRTIGGPFSQRQLLPFFLRPMGRSESCRYFLFRCNRTAGIKLAIDRREYT